MLQHQPEPKWQKNSCSFMATAVSIACTANIAMAILRFSQTRCLFHLEGLSNENLILCSEESDQ